MTFSTLGSLVREDLETRAKNLLKWKITTNGASLHSFYAPESIDEEIDFLFNKGYIAQKEGLPSLEYEVTSKGREYVFPTDKN